MTAFTIGKYNGDDSLSWAVFDDHKRPVVTGLSRSQARFHKKRLTEMHGD